MAEKESAFFQACRLIDRKLKEQERVAVALEGGAASGKTTLAAQLSAHYGAPVIAMDDFFLPPALRTPERYSLPGGNIDFERFNAQVAAPLREGRAFSYPDGGRKAGAAVSPGAGGGRVQPAPRVPGYLRLAAVFAHRAGNPGCPAAGAGRGNVPAVPGAVAAAGEAVF